VTRRHPGRIALALRMAPIPASVGEDLIPMSIDCTYVLGSASPSASP
jgi:hypothetical protein